MRRSAVGRARAGCAAVIAIVALAASAVADSGRAARLASAERLFSEGRADEALAAALDAAAGDDDAATARALLLAGRIEASRHRPEQALEHLRRSAVAARRAGEFGTLQEILEATGLQALGCGRPGLAVDSLTRSLALVDRSGREELLGRAHGLLGVALQKVGQYESALEHYRRSAEIYREKDVVVGEISNLLNAGTVEGEWLGRYDDAVRRFRETLALAEGRRDVARELRGLLFLNLAEALSDAGWLEEAVEPVERAAALFDAIGHAAYRARAASTASKIDLLRNEPLRAETAARRAVAIGETIGDPDVLRLGHLRLGRALAALGRGRQAVEQFEAAAGALEQVRREIGVEEMQISFLRDKQETYEAWIDQLHRLHHDEPHAGWDAIALRASERGRCRSFIDHLPRAGRSVAPPEPLGLEGIRKLLEPGRVLLEYFFGRERVYLFAVDHERLTFADLGPARDLADRIAFLAGDLRSRRPGTTADRQAAEELSARLLLEPLGGRLPNGPVTVAPDGPLFTLPFRILIETRGRDDVPVSYVPSATVLAWTRRPRRSSPSPSVLAVGVDDAGDRGIEVRPLALARREAAQAASFFPRAARRVLVGDVSETAVREALGEPFDVVHFATHAWVDAQDPGRGGLVLHASKDAAPGRDDDDGLLSAREIAEMDLGARVVILSGCATAGGELAPGEGVLGLGRSFLRAGAGSLLVTLWDVSDRAAFEITGRFYEEAARGIPLDRALARTQRALGDLPDARAFVLVGDGRMTLNGLTPPPRRARALVASLLIAAGALLGILAWRRRQTAP